MAETPKIVIGTLSGVPILATKDVGWSITRGTRPHTAVFDVPRAAMPILIGNGGFRVPHKLQIGDNVYEFIFIVKQRAGENPHVGRITLADRRYWWPYIHVKKDYNRRRRVGTRRRGSWSDILQEDVTQEIQFAKYSVQKNGDPWTAEKMLEDFFTDVDALNVPKAQFRIDASLKALAQMPVDAIDVDDQGDVAAARILASIPGSDVTVDPDGAVRVYSPQSGRETLLVGKGELPAAGQIGPEIVGGGHIEVVTDELVSPSAIDVYFTIEQEIRVNFKSDAPAPGQTIAEEPLTDFIADNVAPLPDIQLNVGEGPNSKTLYTGTYVPIEQLIKAWADDITAEYSIIPNITASLLDKAMVPGVDFWAALDLLGSLDANAERANWSARIATLKQNYLRTFRIHSEIMDRVRHLKAELTTTLDVVSGQRAAAIAYSDHAYLPSRKGHVVFARDTEDRFFAVNVEGYPEDAAGKEVEITDAVRPSPARVSVLDEDQGIVHLDYILDPFGFRDTVLPAKILNDAAGGTRPAKFSMRNSDRHFPPASNAIAFDGGAVPRLDPRKRVAIILTAVPAAPNNKRQYYRIRVEPKDVEGVLSPAAAEGLRLARGPIRQIRIGPGLETARSRWQLAAIETIKRVFGIDGSIDDIPASSKAEDGSIIPGAPATYRELMKELVINDAEQEDIVPGRRKAASLPAIARAAAASVWARHAKRVQGHITGAMVNPRIEGQVQELRSYIDMAGARLIQANLPDEIEPIALFSYMDASTRNILLKVPIA